MKFKAIKQIILLIFINCCAVFCELVDEKVPMVQYSNGWVIGKSFKTANSKEFDGFLGIPFAKPPIGDLRLKDPQPFTDTFTEYNPYNATEEKPFCIQKNYLMPNPFIIGVEDCLYLYVYRPRCKQYKKCQRPLPVIVYIHGGAFFAGAAGPSISGADYIMDTEDVIFVTMNYRLGPLGFLSTGDENMSGNYGLKDQAMALIWVNKNIDKFGGDPNNVSLMGQSAGGASVHLHMMSDWSRNLFHRAIVLSGNGLAPYAYVIKDPMIQARNYARFAGIKSTTHMSSSMLSEELRKVDVKNLINATDHFKIWSVDPLIISRPVVEDCSTINGFLCDNPVELWKNGNYSRIPFLTGYMNGDGGVRALAYFENQTLLHELNENFDRLVPKLLEIEDQVSDRVTADRLQMIKNRYLGGRSKITYDDIKNVVQLYTDRSFLAPMANTLLKMIQNDRKSSAYLYKFSFKGRLSYSMVYTGTLNDFGTVHCDELIYLLKSPLIFPAEFEIGSKEASFRKNFVKFFTDFAIRGIPQRINGKTVHRCTQNEMIDQGSKQLRCNYVDFSDKIAVRFDDVIDYSTVDFWNVIDDTLVV